MYGRVLAAGVVLALSLAGCAATGGSQGDRGSRPSAARTKPVSAQKSGTRTVRKRESIPNGTQTHRTTRLDRGERRVTRRGHDGLRVTTWRVTTKNGKVTDRVKVRSVVVRKPVPRVVFVGTYAAPALAGGCDPNYSSGCVPVASDVDCAGGSGDGPAYVSGTVRVVGNDPYGLDADDDGWGCN
ncbi:G5 domain-containing protein [Nocardioides sp. SR21]|uniref:G5 domain-containing protein n=1 Tax=Nocardioides sp. SR21 TaxID=2919501 RepID=UPI001FAAF5F8|nr:G5 domain-containing protein [Nocardioides sp. SR21]